MIFSMTGFGKRTFEFNSKTFSIEIRSLNSKQTDIYTKIPPLYKEKEIELRNLASAKLHRGKIEISLMLDVSDDANVPAINKAAVKKYYNQILEISAELGMRDQDQNFIWATMLRLPESLQTQTEALDEPEWEEIKKHALLVMEDVRNFRETEGASMEKDISTRIGLIADYLNQVEPFEQNRVKAIRERIKNNLHEFIPSENIDENRFEQEIIFYLEKFDITEEKVRLSNHCNYFLQTMKTKEPVGKKLGFISQEIGREINTIGSKANDADIQKLVVQMKDELEKVKEQLMNVL